jgi:hypothetical protein
MQGADEVGHLPITAAAPYSGFLHPRWEPRSIGMSGITFDALAETLRTQTDTGQPAPLA